jgi:hypothetical protein
MTTQCTRCGGPIVEIVLGSGSSKLTMRSCSTCDAREWQSDGEPVELDDVLGELNNTGVQRRNRRTF